MIRRLLFFVLMCTSVYAHAVTYFYTAGGYTQQFPTPAAACSYYGAAPTSVVKENGTWTCWNGTPPAVRVYIYRNGNACGAGASLDPSTEQCVCPSGQSMAPDGTCAFVQCPQGQYWWRDASLTCHAPDDEHCPVGTVASGNSCIAKTCPSPTVLNPATGVCTAPEEYPCPSGTTKQPDGNCKADSPTKGEKGDKGDKGEQGTKGDKGDKGDAGADGAKGDKGDQGIQGEQGNQGAMGSAGRNGTDGRNGVDGAQGIRGLQGAQGSQGAQGTTGAQGLQGIQGAQGLQGIQGRTGDTGSAGINGINGATGTAGAQGIQGIAGVAGTDGEKGETGKGLCEENPALAVCKNSTVAGSCEAVSCTGDAIQCATLRAAAALQCAQATSDAELAASPLNAVGQAAVDGSVDPGAPTKENGEHIDLPSSLDANGWLGGGKCFADKTITLQGHQILIPLSAGCDAMLVLRYALMVVASLVSFRILSRAVLS